MSYEEEDTWCLHVTLHVSKSSTSYYYCVRACVRAS
jgi:hypothetical protein